MERQSVFFRLCFTVISLFLAYNDGKPWARERCFQIDDGYDCSDLDLKLIPDEVPNSVRILKFSFNYLPSLYNFTFQRLRSLTFLELTRCGIVFMYEDIFENQPHLEVLILIGNPLVFIANRAFVGPQALKHLSLAQSKIKSLSDIPSDNLVNLEVLDLRGSDIRSLDGLSSFHFQKLRMLKLDMNSIERITADDLKPLHYVVGMNISFKGNDIVYVEPGAFQSLTLGSLDISGCLGKMDISVLLKGLEGIKTNRLNLGLYESDPAVHIPSSALQCFCNISVTDLDFQIVHFSDLNNSTFRCLEGLQKLDLTRTHLGLLPSILTGLSTLSHLVLDENSFLDVCHINSRNFPKLTHLSISGNMKKLTFSSRCLESLGRLEELDLSISQVNPTGPCCNDQLFGLGHLKVLNLSYGSPMRWNSQPFSVVPQLEHLDFSRSSYTLNDSSPFSSLQNLSTLNISWSNTNLTNVQLFKGLKNLRLLNLKGNPILGGVLTQTELFKPIPVLETLILSACRITAFKENLFKELTQLKQVDFSENQLTKISTAAFYSLKFLQLNFANNFFVTVDVGSVMNLGNGSSVDLSYNPLACNCSNFQFMKWVKDNKVKVRQLMETVCNGTGTRIIDVHLQCEFSVGILAFSITIAAIVIASGAFCLCRRIRRRYARYSQL
ncbi:CD180 antigen-like [Xyrauchen texanus]|uniref:CD180 antigen-like n=1 Tax=Xyrauchen texanus TaxID=154827 RepID=UPI0022429EFD|nr:CD180 antigen-like [Xyrauchen texanus]